MTKTKIVLAVLLTIAGGCDRDGRVDAGGDSGVDAGTIEDASIDDAEVDGGTTPDPLAVAVDDARGDANDVASAQAALDPSVTDGLEFLQLDLAQTRVDAIIGEKSTSLVSIAGIIGEKSRTLAFGTPVSGVVVMVRQLVQAQLELGAVAEALDPSTEPSLGPLVDAITAEILSLGALRMQLLSRYDELVALDATLPGTEELGYSDRRSVDTMPDRSVVFAMLEGTDGHSVGTITVTCSRGGTAPIAIVVHDDRDDSELHASTIGAGPHTFAVRTDAPTMLRIDFALSGISYDRCDVDVQGRRHFREAPTVLDSLDVDDLGTRRIDWDSRMSTLTGTIAMMRSEGTAEDVGLADIVEAYLLEASSESGRWRGGLTSIGPEDLEILELTLGEIVIPLGTELETYLETSTSRFAAPVQQLLGELRAHQEAALAILTTP